MGTPTTTNIPITKDVIIALSVSLGTVSVLILLAVILIVISLCLWYSYKKSDMQMKPNEKAAPNMEMSDIKKLTVI